MVLNQRDDPTAARHADRLVPHLGPSGRFPAHPPDLPEAKIGLLFTKFVATKYAVSQALPIVSGPAAPCTPKKASSASKPYRRPPAPFHPRVTH